VTEKQVQEAVAELAERRAKGATAAELVAAQYDAGLAWPHFRVGRGGLGLTKAEAADVRAQLRSENYPQSPGGFVGVHQVANLLHDVATEEMQDRFLRSIFTGADQWCQLFSEPGAGSDLANVATRATYDGDQWHFEGQKIWTSNARHANHGLLLTRTDATATKHAGLTLFVLDMNQPGVIVRPLHQMDGGERFSEVFIDNAVAPNDGRIGELGEGWRLSMKVLGTERDGASDIFARPITELLEIWNQRKGILAPALRDHLVQLWIRNWTGQVSRERMRSTQQRDVATRLGAIAKVTAAERAQAHAHLLTLLLGTDAVTCEDYLATASDDAKAASASSADFAQLSPHRFILRSRAMSIEGGTSEIGRNIVGERVLGLPAEPRIDKGKSWNELTRP
jgi:alkylation response protein AidB-like acyl-CoA dehydrogenase